MRRDAYEVLGVDRGADDRAIKKRFRVLARELHPDVNAEADAEERFKEAAEAYEVLSDPQRRETYDRYGWEGLDSRGQAPHAHGFGSFSDILSGIFNTGGGRSTRTKPATERGKDLETAVTLSFEQALTGVEEAQWVSMSGFVRAAEPDGPWVRLDLTTSAGEFHAMVPPNERWAKLPGAGGIG